MTGVIHSHVKASELAQNPNSTNIDETLVELLHEIVVGHSLLQKLNELWSGQGTSTGADGGHVRAGAA